tara:strand:+ start:1579 stop:1755 length:177 start_codon:yes stop_codon:yes gene_type:complete
MLLAGVRFNHDWSLSGGGFQPEGFVEFNSQIGKSVKAFAEATATAEELAGAAGIKITW